MTRKKVKIVFVTNDSARKATYKKRKRGLLKKMDELTTLCDVKANAILYSPYEARPVVWPGPSEAKDVIASFKRLHEMEEAKKTVSQEEFQRQRVAKAHKQLKKQQKDNREKYMTQVIYQCLVGKGIQNMSLLDLSDLSWVINQHLGQPPAYQQAMGPRMVFGGLQRHQKDDLDAIQMHPWSSFMEMMGPSMTFDHQPPLPPHHHPHHGAGMRGGGSRSGFAGVTNGGGSGSTSTSTNNNMNIMIMGQFSEYHGHDVNLALWSNTLFP